MVVSAASRLTESRPQPTGVFEDDALLLLLAERARRSAGALGRRFGVANRDVGEQDFGGLADSQAWDL